MRESNRLKAEQRNGRCLNVQTLCHFIHLQNVTVGCLREARDSLGKKCIFE